MKLFYSIDKMNYLGKQPAPTCHQYTDSDIFDYNYHIWTVAYFVGLQFTHLDQGIFG